MAKKADPAAMLADVDLFAGLSKKDLKRIQAVGKEVHFPAGRTIVEQGDTGVAFHLILDGKAKVDVHGARRRPLGPGDYFGEISLIDREPRSATVTADSDVRTFAIASWDFMPLVADSPTMAKKMLLEMCRRIRSLEESFKH